MNIATTKSLWCLLNVWAFSGIILLVVTPILYLHWNGFIEQGEVSFSVVSWLLSQGHPLYTSLDAAERYSLEHGPIVYLIIGSVMKVLGPSYTTSKIVNVLALLLTILISWLWFSKLINKRDAFYLLGLECWLLLHWTYSYLVRPDSIMLLCVAVSMYIATTKQDKLWLILGIAIPWGIMMNLKIHGLFYFLPIAAIVYPCLGRRSFLAIFGIVLLLGIAPFLLPQISFANYLQWLYVDTHHGIKLHNISAKILFIFQVFLIPVAIGIIRGVDLQNFYRRYKHTLLALLIALLIPAIIGSKMGCGTNHLIPFIPIFVYIILLLVSAARERGNTVIHSPRNIKLCYLILTVGFLIITISGINGEQRVLTPMLALGNRVAVIQDIQAIERQYAGKTLEIGWGEDKSFRFYRDFVPLPVFHGNPYLVDKVAIGDMYASGLPIPPATIKDLDEGAIQVWLIPLGDPPFAMYASNKSFQQEFLKNYTLAERTKFFDVWVYKHGNGGEKGQ